jgi:alpha-maltose-1-phosphate synthase
LIDDLKVTVVSPYPFHMVDQARQLHRGGVLERMVTAVPRTRVGLPGELVRNRLRWSGFRRVVGRAVPRTDPLLNRKVVRDFDRWARSRLGEPSVVNALSGYATETLTAASARGTTVFCDRGSWHILEQQRVLDEEADRIGAPKEHFDPFIIDRELREYELVDRILVPSEPARQSFIRRGTDPDRVVKVPYGVDISAFSVSTAAPIPGAVVSVATVGLQKGHHELLEGFRVLRTKNASLTLVGAVMPGWYERLRLDQPGVRVTGSVSRSRVVEELQRASVFVLASVHDGFGLVLAQAMACGLPVIATEATGIRELISDGVEGIVVPAPPDARSLAEAMDVLLSDSDKARAMGAAGRRRVESFGGWDRYGRQLVAAFDAGRSGQR